MKNFQIFGEKAFHTHAFLIEFIVFVFLSTHNYAPNFNLNCCISNLIVIKKCINGMKYFNEAKIQFSVVKLTKMFQKV